MNLLWNIKTKYEFGYLELVRVSPRFGVLMGSMLFSIAFILVDILAVTHVISGSGLPDGINPFWKLATVFKLLTDTIVLDDFKSALDRLSEYRMQRMASVASDNIRGTFTDVELARRKKDKEAAAPLSGLPAVITKDWTDSDHIDLESALRMDKRAGESSGSSGG
jgi:hypothetical protein